VNPNVRVNLTIPSSHPALPGHFPGRPVVPGAVILAEVVHAATNLLGAVRVTGLTSVKFSSPMLPEQRCELVLANDGAGVALFELTRDGARVASGRLQYKPAATS
jgi:3-hydroxyacyl-[acyl-carrier-protein] dehydratase